MGKLAEKLDALTITVSSPDSMIRARVKAGRPEAIAFRSGAYDAYQRSNLEHQLARTASLCFVGHQRGTAQLMDQFGVDWPTDPRKAWSLGQKTYLTEVSRLTVIGPTENAPVAFAVSGIANWRCRIAEDALETLTEKEFVAATLTAANEQVRRLTRAKAVLRAQHLNRNRPHAPGPTHR